ncbi:MAG: acetyl-CoA C-acetyltransferase [Acidobacteria bacterium]|nr:MAG: acetyl-CoA C-acetyltransferase [Acidobacteriota bacterium]
MEKTVIVSACRTPIGRFLGALSPLPATRLGALVVREAVSRAGIAPGDVDEVIMGNVVQAGLGQNPARQAAIWGGVPESVGAFTVNKVCGSSLKAVMLADQAIRAGDADIIVAGGMESMSNCPYLVQQARTGLRMGHAQLVDSMIHDGLWDVYNDVHMGETAEMVADRYEVSREEMDAWALMSHERAIAAIDAGKFRDEIVPVEVPQRKGETKLVDTDEGPRRDTSLEKLARLKPAFRKDGRVTAGNSPGVNDGAAAVVVAREGVARERGLPVLGRVVASVTSGLAPEWVLMTPEPAIRAVLDKAGWSMDEVDLFEINEAFAVQQVALGKVLGIPREKHNVHGGGVALGHPIGASGARCLTTALYAMRDRDAHRAVVSLCLGGGNAVAVAIER